MKQTILFILLGFMLNAALAQKYSFRLKGDIINAEDGKVALYSPADSVHALLRTDIKDGLFALAGKLKEPGYYILDVSGAKFPIILDSKEMTHYGDYLEPDTKLLKGSPSVKTRLEKDRLYYQTQELPLQHAIEKFYQMAENGDNLSENADDFMRKNIQKIHREWEETLLDFVRQHPDDLYIPVLIIQEINTGNIEWGQKAYGLLTPKMQNSQPGRLLKQALGKE